MQNRRSDVVSKRETAFVYVSTTSPAEAKQWIQDISAQGNNPNYLGTFRLARAKQRGSRSEEEFVKYLIFYFAANIVKGRVLILDVDLSQERYLSVELLLTRLGGARGPRVDISKIGSALASCTVTPQGEKLVYPEYENKFEPGGHHLFRRELIRAIANDCRDKRTVCVHLSRIKDIVEWDAAFGKREVQYFGNCEPLLQLRASFPKVGDDEEAIWYEKGETKDFGTREKYVKNKYNIDDSNPDYPEFYEDELTPIVSPLVTAVLISFLVQTQEGDFKSGIVINTDYDGFHPSIALALVRLGYRVALVNARGEDVVEKFVNHPRLVSNKKRFEDAGLRNKGVKFPRFQRLKEMSDRAFFVSSDSSNGSWLEGAITVAKRGVQAVKKVSIHTNNYIRQTGGRYVKGSTVFLTGDKVADHDVTRSEGLLEVVKKAVGYSLSLRDMSEALLYPLQTYLHVLGRPPKGTHYIIDHSYFMTKHLKWEKGKYYVHREQEPMHPVKLASIFNSKGVTFHILCHSSQEGKNVISEGTRNTRSSVSDLRIYHAVRSVDLIKNWSIDGKIVPVSGETALEFVVRKTRFQAISPAVQQHVSYKTHILVLTNGDPVREQTIFDPLSIHAKAYGVFLNDSINGLTMATKFARGRFIRAIFGDRVGGKTVKNTRKQRFYGSIFFPEVEDIEIIGAAEFEVRLKLVSGQKVDVLVSGHMFNNLFGSDIDVVDIESYLKQIENNVRATRPGKVVPLKDALESTDNGKYSLWHNYYDYQLACVMYMHMCFIKAFTDPKKRLSSSILLAIYASKRLNGMKKRYPWFVGKTIASQDPRGLKTIDQPSDVIVA